MQQETWLIALLVVWSRLISNGISVNPPPLLLFDEGKKEEDDGRVSGEQM